MSATLGQGRVYPKGRFVCSALRTYSTCAQDLRGKAVGTSPIYMDRLRKVSTACTGWYFPLTSGLCLSSSDCRHPNATATVCLVCSVAFAAVQYGLQPTPYPFNKGSDYLVWR